MASPVLTPYHSFIQIDRQAPTAVYLQIARQLMHAIQRGFIAGGTKLPGSRQLAALLNIHRNTLVAAYNELDVQGWVEILPNQGTFVRDNWVQKTSRLVTSKGPLQSSPQLTGYDFQRDALLDSVEKPANVSLACNDGLPDIRLSSFKDLNRGYAAVLKRANSERKLHTLNQHGNQYFKRQLSNYLNLTRGLYIGAQQILVTRSAELSLYLVAQTLLRQGDHVIIGNPSYYTANMIFQKAGAIMLPVAMDGDGIDVDQIEILCKRQPIRMLYLTPHHHYPTTVTLSAGRRIQLLQLANRYGFIILEDDFDYEYHYSPVKIVPLASVDDQGMVVYMGSFGRSLAPGFRRGFILAPENLIVELGKLQQIMDPQTDVFMEHVLGELIEEGEIHRFTKKNTLIYQGRRDHMAGLLSAQLAHVVEFTIPQGGLALWINWRSDINLLRLSRNCAQQGLYLPQNLLYQTQDITGMRLGFAHLDFEEQAVVVAQLRKFCQ
ncbi:PLP-dependent aminotransferase family protein [Sphingobacteriaceae bacterium WQ 2009]|uniref:PLP-dependent aminotransferase family protein n=1 Tax=Rhinopithecimicrobium faecis TaxID=2820698 RepID=A0A8T4HE92_9SPHI|nr:PLP-dependent aminotransferase family protein [Sphingobacteriaceae bacterium WQ 2009]